MKWMAFKTPLLGVVISFYFGSCTEKKTTDPIESYKLWAGDVPPGNVNVVHGNYWQSANWSKEYILYMELKAPLAWLSEFIKQNNLVETNVDPVLPSDVPTWFSPGKSFKVLMQKNSGGGSAYFEDTVNGKMFIYEIQL